MNSKLKPLALTVVAVLVGQQAFAAGFEKAVLWGARSSGVAGIASPYITGSQALYFNPAGLATDKTGHDVSLNVSPTWAQFKGPINYQNEEASSSTSLTTPFGLIYGGTIDKQFGFGVGGYTAGGSVANFENVPFAGTAAGSGNVKTDLKLNEFAIGAGYKINDAWKVGIAWRVLMGTADFSFVQPLPAPATASTAGLVNLDVNGIKATNFMGFRLGTQYRLSERTQIGVMYRSEVEIKGDGTYGGKISSPASPTTPFTVDSSTATVKTIFPMQFNVGATHDYDKWRSLLEYSWTQYSRVGEIVVDGAATRSGGAAFLPYGTRLNTQWRDQHQVRVGGEYMGMSWPVRLGYVWTSAVTNASYARAQFTPPGSGHTLTTGTGQSFDIGGNPLQFDIGADYTMGSADSDDGAPAGATTNSSGGFTRAGTFKAAAYALHLGVGYSF